MGAAGITGSALCSCGQTPEKPEAPTPPKQHQGFKLRKWAWEDSNLRPHAYQGPVRIYAVSTARRRTQNVGGTRNLHVEGNGAEQGAGGSLTPLIDTSGD